MKELYIWLCLKLCFYLLAQLQQVRFVLYIVTVESDHDNGQNSFQGVASRILGLSYSYVSDVVVPGVKWCFS